MACSVWAVSRAAWLACKSRCTSSTSVRGFRELAEKALRSGEPPPPAELQTLLPSAREEAVWLGQGEAFETLLASLPRGERGTGGQP